MAFLPQDEQNQNAPQGQTTNNPQNVPPQGIGGSVGAGSAGPKAGSSPSTGTSTQFGSSASKLGDYLSANAPQITNQANQIATGLGNQYNQTNQDISNAANQFNQQVQGGYTAQNKDVVDQAAKNAPQFVQDPNNVKAFQSQYNDQYTGPQSFEGSDQYGNIQNEVNSAVQNASLLQTPAGLQSYLAGQQKNPTRASTTLDQLLLNGNPEAQQKIQTAANQFNDLTGNFGDVATAANSQAQTAQAAADAARQYAQNKFTGEGGVLPEWQKNLQNSVAQKEGDRTAYNQNLYGAQNQARDFMQMFNNASAAGGLQNFTMGDALSKYLAYNPVTNPATLESVATPQDFETQNALQSLLGSAYGNDFLNESLANQAGTFKTPDNQPLPSNWASVLEPLGKNFMDSWQQQARTDRGWANNTGRSEPAFDLFKQLSQYDPNFYATGNRDNGVSEYGLKNYKDL